jgi:hypothetical protein
MRHRSCSAAVPVLSPEPAAGPAKRRSERARADRVAGNQAARRAPSPLDGALPRLRSAGCGRRARDRHAVWPAPARETYQALSYERLQALLTDLFGLRLSQGGLMHLLRRTQRRFEAGCEQARRRPAPGRGSGLRRDRGEDRGQHGLSLGISVPRRRRAPRRPDAGRRGGPGDDGRPQAAGLAVGPLRGPARARPGPADVPRASGPRRRLRPRGQRRPRPVPAQILADLSL